MAAPLALSTSRLLLRQWRDSDLDAFAAINADPEVRAHFPGLLSRDESAAELARAAAHIETHGWGFFAVERRADAACIGMCGLKWVSFEAAFTPAVEIGWRLARPAWGQGLASEAAHACVRLGFAELGLDEIVSFTVPGNLRSQAVMRRIGMQRDTDGDFDHPKLPDAHPLRRHVLYRLRRD